MIGVYDFFNLTSVRFITCVDYYGVTMGTTRDSLTAQLTRFREDKAYAYTQQIEVIKREKARRITKRNEL